MKPTILRFDVIDSTNLEAMRQAKAGAPEGLCLVARQQTHGRGRQDRSWHSPSDAGLYFSILLRPRIEISKWPLISLISALAVSDALMSTSNLGTDIKWPNDVCVGERKLCGVLAETVESSTGSAAIVGIGINLQGQAFPDELKEAATSVEAETGSKPDLESILAAVIKSFRERYEFLHQPDSVEHTIREWCAHSSYAFDRRVRVSLHDEVFYGTTRGLEGDGALRVEDHEGKMRIVRAGDVTAFRGA
jgi:BirA family transcriptional regulator, biotin operon repressor / biotin---[acetyl-CoA-carboxylase] ligase